MQILGNIPENEKAKIIYAAVVIEQLTRKPHEHNLDPGRAMRRQALQRAKDIAQGEPPTQREFLYVRMVQQAFQALDDFLLNPPLNPP